jgi:hypothetical protein
MYQMQMLYRVECVALFKFSAVDKADLNISQDTYLNSLGGALGKAKIP